MENHRNAISVFLSYAHEDELLLRQLETHLSLLKRQGLISTWYDRQIVPGTSWAEVIDERLEQASIILLLVSPDFLASDYCYQVEMKRALERHEADQARVIPIFLRPADWKGAPFAHLQALPTDAKAITTWRNRDRALVDVTAGIRRTIEDLSLLPASLSRAALPAIWNIPYPRNPFFLGRDDILSHLHTQLQVGQVVPSQALSGLGGIGKTQIAVEYAYRYSHNYNAVLWCRAHTADALIAGYSEIAYLLDLPERNEQDQNRIIKAVQVWFRMKTKWLLILDNADDLVLIREFLPSAYSGHILLTTRSQTMGRLAGRIEVDTMDSETGALLLLRRASLITPDVSLAAALPSDILLARDLAEELGGLPLALDQAAAYIEETGCHLADYQSLYQTRRAELLHIRGGFVDDHPEPVATTWSLSFDKIEQSNPAAADLLRICAFFAPDAIPEELLTNGAKKVGEVLAPVAADTYLLNQSIIALRAYSLLSRDSQTRTLNIHRLVQVVLRDNMSVDIQRQWMQRAIQAVAASLPERPDFDHWPTLERLVTHALICANWIEQASLTTHIAAILLSQTGYYLHERGRDKEAEFLYQRALAIHEQILEVEHPSMIADLNNLAMVYLARGKYSEAESLLQRALVISEQQLGSEHLNTAQILNSLANLYHTQSKYEEAGALSQRVLAIREQHLGAMHLSTAISLSNLGQHYKEQGKHIEAEPLLQRALSIYEQQLGSEHPDTATSLRRLADLYHSQGKYSEAESLLRHALVIHEQQLGATHPSTMGSLNNLAELYDAQGKYTEAEPLLQRALAVSEQQLGAEHPDTVVSLSNLAALYLSQGKYTEAEPLMQRALEVRERMFGTEHPDTAISLNNLAELYKRQGKYTEAEPLLQRALSINEQQLGTMHFRTASSLNNLANLYQNQNKYTEAEPLMQRALEVQEHTFGAEHPDTAISLNNLATLYLSQGKYADAEPLLQRALAIHEKVLGSDHPKTALSLSMLAVLYQTQEQYAVAEPLSQRALAIQERQLGKMHPDMLSSLANLALIYLAQGKYVEVAPLWERVFLIHEQILGPSHPNTPKVRFNYIRLLRMLGRDEEANKIAKPS